MAEALKWLPRADVHSPCADISFVRSAQQSGLLVVVMHFSKVIDGVPRDLEIQFPHPLAVQWAEESFGLIDCPQILPKCSASHFTSWTHPTLIVKGSEWAERYAARKYAVDPKAENVNHYLLVSMNDLLHVVNEGEPIASWVEPKNP
jgi:hypothetical protein